MFNFERVSTGSLGKIVNCFKPKTELVASPAVRVLPPDSVHLGSDPVPAPDIPGSRNLERRGFLPDTRPERRGALHADSQDDIRKKIMSDFYSGIDKAAATYPQESEQHRASLAFLEKNR